MVISLQTGVTRRLVAGYFLSLLSHEVRRKAGADLGDRRAETAGDGARGAGRGTGLLPQLAPPGVGEHVAVVRSGELADAVRVGVHDLSLSELAVHRQPSPVLAGMT